jgi:hypothetical protein
MVEGQIDPNAPFIVVDSVAYPPRLFRQPPKWLHEVAADEIHGMLLEIYSALWNDSKRLATLGIRALFERIMVKTVGDQGSFRQNLEFFTREGFIGTRNKEAIERILEVGHAAMHRGFSPESATELGLILDVTESILYQHFVLPEHTAKIAERTPVRQRPQRPCKRGTSDN